MRIVHVVTYPRAEGTPRLVLDWLNANTSHTQDVVFLSDQYKELLDDFQQSANSIRFTNSLRKGFRKIIPLISSIHKACKEFKPDLLICWNTGLSQWIHIGARLAGVKMLLTHAGNPPYGRFVQRQLYSYMSFWIGGLVGARTIVPSDYILKEFHSIPLLSNDHFRRVYNCVNVDKFIRPDGGSRGRDVIMVATLESHKDHTTLLKAWKIIEAQMSPAKLMIVGKGQKEGELKKLCEDLNLHNIVFTGSRQDIPQLLWASGLFVLSTTTAEGFGTVLIEALATGMPVVATDVPACREVLRDGTYGTLVPEKNERALANAILSVQDDQLLTGSRIEYARQFSPAKMIEDYLSIAIGSTK